MTLEEADLIAAQQSPLPYLAHEALAVYAAEIKRLRALLVLTSSFDRVDPI